MRTIFLTIFVLCCDILAAQKFEAKELMKPGSEFFSTAFNVDSRILATGDQQGKIYLWDVVLNQQINTFQSPLEKVLKLAFSRDGNFLASAGKGSGIFVWSVRYGLNEKILQGHDGVVTSIAFSNGNRFLVSAGTDKKVVVWDFVTGKILHTLSQPTKEISDIEFSSDGKLMVIGGYDGKIYFYNMSDFSLEKMIAPEGGRIRAVALSPDGKFVAAACDKKGIVVYEVYSGYMYKILPIHKDIVYDMSVSSDGKYIFCGTLNNVLNVTELHGDKSISIPSRLYQFVSLSASQDGTRMAVADASAKVRLFDMSDLKIKPISPTTVNQPNIITEDIHIELLEPFHPFDSAYAAQSNKLKFKGIVSSKHGLAELTINNRKVTVSPSGLFEDEFNIPLGRWVIPIVARDFNNLEVVKHFVTYRDNKNDETRFRNGKDYALLVGTDQYNELEQLNNPIYDITTIKQELEQLYGFETKLLINPTKSQLQEEIRNYSKREYSKTDQLFIFIAGHGVYDEVFKEGYIATRDSRKDDEIKDSYISYANFRNYVNNIPCSHVMVALDVCYGGTFNPAVASRGINAVYNDLDRQLFIASKLKYKARKYVTSGGKVYVSDGVKGHHSPFARRFIEALRNRGGDDRILTFNEIIPYVEKTEPSPTFGGFGTDEPGSDFIFIGKE